MFKNEYQGGSYFEIFSPQGRDPAANWKIGAGVKKVYEKDVKGYVYILEGTPSTTKVHFPKDNKHSIPLVQRYLVLQLHLTKAQEFSVELGVCDLANNKRRIQLSTALKETQITPLHARIPLCIVRRAVWLNLCLDMVSMVGDTWSGQTFHAVDHITLSANCKLRRIFTMKSQPPDTTDDDELYSCQSSQGGEVELIPKQVHLSPDIPQFTQVLTMNKIKSAERVKGGKGLGLADQIRPGSMFDLDLNSSGNRGNYHIAFGSKVNTPAAETSRRSSRQGSTTNRSFRSSLSHPDGSVGSGSVRDLRDSVTSQEGVLTSRTGHKDTSARSAKPITSGQSLATFFSRQHSEPHTQEEADSSAINGVNGSQLVTPHPPREPSNDRVRRYHRVKSVAGGAVGSSSATSNGRHSSKDRVSSAGSIGEEPATDSGISSKTTTTISPPSSSTITRSPVASATEPHKDTVTSVQRSGDQQAINSQDRRSLQYRGQVGEVQDSVSDVIALLRANADGDGMSSDSGTESSQPGEYEESDDEGSSDTNKLHLFVSRPMLAPHRNVSPGTADQEPSKRSHAKASRSNVRRSTSEIMSSRGARPEDDFHSITSSDDDDNYHKHRGGQGSRPHSGTSASGSPKTKVSAGQTERTGGPRGRNANVPKASVSPDFKRPPFNPSLYGGVSSRGDAGKDKVTASQTPVRRSRKSLREIKPHFEENTHTSRQSDKAYDHTKYQMAEVTESFEARMLASMRRQEEEELEDVSPPPAAGPSGTRSTHRNQPHAGPVVRASQHVYSESPATTSDDDTSFSTWKAPAPNQMAHNYQDEMKSRLSSDTLTSSNPRDWSSVFSPPIILPSDRDLQGTLEGQFEDLNEATPDHHTVDCWLCGFTAAACGAEDEELDLMFDPNLNCYYDPRTLKYYELVT
ncbi:hypothetical protein BaRGS_00014890 [Batillaria attramentaria]|uniref:CFA20 domain-containing protein n=1 Tax=Batillaria attramentaria TaxID=370345 RepID=A0ABD0L3Y3_9CAEN